MQRTRASMCYSATNLTNNRPPLAVGGAQAFQQAGRRAGGDGLGASSSRRRWSPRVTDSRKPLVIGLIARMHLGLHDRAGVQVHDRLGPVDHVRPTMLSGTNLGIRVMRVLPFLIAAFA